MYSFILATFSPHSAPLKAATRLSHPIETDFSTCASIEFMPFTTEFSADAVCLEEKTSVTGAPKKSLRRISFAPTKQPHKANVSAETSNITVVFFKNLIITISPFRDISYTPKPSGFFCRKSKKNNRLFYYTIQKQNCQE